MRRRRRIGAALLAALGASLQAQRVTTLQYGEELSVKQVWYEDVNGDGTRDLVVAVVVRGQDYQRRLHVHYARSGRTAFAQSPDLTVAVPRSVAAAAVGDVHQDPGAEIIWFGSRGAYAYRPHAPVSEREVKLVGCEFLFQYPHPKLVLSWQAGVRDLNGDGLADLLLPEPDGYRVAVQRRDAQGAATFRVSTLRVPAAAPRPQGSPGSPVRQRKISGGIAIDILGPDQVATPNLVTIDEQVGAPQVHDWDGDGDLDVISKQGERVSVWLQGADGTFPTAPDKVLPFPLTDEQTRLDPRFSASLVDFNRDRRVDAILLAKDANSEELRTHIMFFPQQDGPDPLFAKGVPGQLLILAGFTSPPAFSDIDGNGTVDLHISSWRLDVVDQLTSVEKQSLDIEIYVYLNKQGRFSRQPDLSHRETLEGEVLRSGGNRLTARFIGDVTGDRVSDLLVRDRPERVRVLMVKRRGDKLELLSKPVWEMRISPKADLQYLPESAGQPGFLVLESQQVLLVGFR